MSSAKKALSRMEFCGLLAASALLMAWYAYPQILFALYPPYELLRLVLPGLLPDLAPAASSIVNLPDPPR
jgi:hypothetical protein